ncbi:MAG: glycosyltransferase family 4 protein [Tepidanaerobacteraceae bacterium]|nr:glycosyltransferase family 4 protein [Tepidanaerobacteraceae bacterium]
MNIAILSTYFPRECGIASFSRDLRNNLIPWDQIVSILAISDKNGSYKYPKEVVFDLEEDKRDNYAIAAQYVNTSDIDLVFVEHEYGIFGGNDGEFVLDFVENLEKPFLLNTHTVLPSPDFRKRRILSKLGQKSVAVICMTHRSAELLNKVYNIPHNKLYMIHHGVPIFKEKPRKDIKKVYGIDNRPLVLTFGFLGPGKGIELGIRAISYLKNKYPDIIYLVAGETHPNLRKKMGEVYRESLVDLIQTLGVDDNIKFINKYLSLEELGEVLYMADVYLTPYPNRNQAVSGTLAYAIGCGRAIVSAPYDYSLEVLSNGRGLVASKADPEELASLIDMVQSNPQLKEQLEKKADKLGKTMSWPQVGKRYVNIIENVLQANAERKVF